MLLLAITLWGASTCPDPAEIAKRLSVRTAVPLDVQVSYRDGRTLLTLRTEGRTLALHALSSTTCAELTDEAALVVGAWAIDFAAVPPRPAATPRAELREPLQVGYIPPPPAREARRHLELGAFAGAQLGSTGRGLGPSLGADVALAPPRDGVVALATGAWSTGTPLFSADGMARASGVLLSIGLGAALRQHAGPFVVDLFLVAPVSLIWPFDVRAELLGGWITPTLGLSVAAGVRVCIWAERQFALYLRAAVDVPVLNSARLQLAPATFSAGFGFAWGGA